MVAQSARQGNRLIAATVALAAASSDITAARAAEVRPFKPEAAAAPTPLSWDSAARQLMNLGQLDQALSIVNTRLTLAPKDVQALFLKGMIAVTKRDNHEAIRVFRSILIDHPDAARVRLELARAFYLD